MKRVQDVPQTLPLVLRPSRAGTLAALGVGILFALVGLFFAVVGNVLVALFCFALAGVGLFGGVMAILPRRSELRLDDRGLEVVSPAKTWRAAWDEIERFEVETVPMGRNSSAPVVRVVYREGLDAVREPKSPVGKVLGVDERYVVPGYGNLDAGHLGALLSRFRERYAG